jgi:hypothetical protein
LEEWLEDEENLNLWENGKLKESEKRILISKFVGAAWEKKISRSDFSTDIYFQKTGCLLTLDGSEDNLVHVQGLPLYKPPFVITNDDSDDETLGQHAEAGDEPSSDLEQEDDLVLEVSEMDDPNENDNFELLQM